MSYMTVAHNFACPTHVRELGEDYDDLRKIERAYRLLEKRINAAKFRVQSRDAKRSLADLDAGLADLRHDSSFGTLLSDAQEAEGEAWVRKVKVAPVGAKERPKPLFEASDAKPICETCGDDLDELTTSKNARDRGQTLCNFCEQQRCLNRPKRYPLNAAR